MAIIIVGMSIFHCILCSSLTCKWVKSEVEEKTESIYEESDYGDSTDEDRRAISGATNIKKYPVKIEYDNKDIYKTQPNYAPNSLNDSHNHKSKRHMNAKSKH